MTGLPAPALHSCLPLPGASLFLSLLGRLCALTLIDKNLILPPWPYKA